MNILVTGANGFVGKNLIAHLKNNGFTNIYQFTRESDLADLEKFTKNCDFVFHLAGVNRPTEDNEFMEVNVGLTSKLLQLLKDNHNSSPIVLTSSIQAEQNTPYGLSKKVCEELLFSHHEATGAKAFVYRLPNLFGKWSKPNYNSVVATFCHNIARNKEIEIHDNEKLLTLCYIDDVISNFFDVLEGKVNAFEKFYQIPIVYNITLRELADKIHSFNNNRKTLIMPSLHSSFDRALYSTFLSYLDENNFSYKLKKNRDSRGWLSEFIKSDSMGQVFISKTKPGIVRGNHWHHTKVEKFLVIQGEATIKFRKIDSPAVLEYRVNGNDLEVVDIPVGYTHSIENTGLEDVITLFWASEIFDPDKTDTYFLEV